MRITTAWLDTRKLPKNRQAASYDVSVDGRRGLIVRVEPTGTISFRMRYTAPGGAKRRWLVFGEYGPGALSLAEAYDLHHEAIRQLAQKLDPIEERIKRRAIAEAERREYESADTVASIVQQFVHRKLRGERWDSEMGTWVRDPNTRIKARERPELAEKALKTNLVEAELDGVQVGSLKARDITRRQIVRLLTAIVDRGSPVMANRFHALLVQLFKWAVSQDLVPASPVVGIDRPGGRETPRDRTLTKGEIHAFWTKLDSAKMRDPTRLALKLLLVTGQRSGELLGARWDDFNVKKKLWTIPPDLIKTSHKKDRPESHIVPLSPLAIELLGTLRKITGERVYVLPNRLRAQRDKPYTERVLSQAIRDNNKHFDLPRFVPHDLRRTAASHMTRLGIPRLHVEKVLNHVTGDIAEVYDRHNYLPEKRVALEKWGKELKKILKSKPTKRRGC